VVLVLMRRSLAACSKSKRKPCWLAADWQHSSLHCTAPWKGCKRSLRLHWLAAAGALLCAGVPLVAAFEEDATKKQRKWLSRTRLPLREVVFGQDDGASTALLQVVRSGHAKIPAPHATTVQTFDSGRLKVTPGLRPVSPTGQAALTMQVCALRPSFNTGVDASVANVSLCLWQQTDMLMREGHAHGFFLLQAEGGMLTASEVTLEGLHNVQLPHERVVRAQLQPLSRFTGLRVLTLRRVFGNAGRGTPVMAIALCQLPASLEVCSAFRQSPMQTLGC